MRTQDDSLASLPHPANLPEAQPAEIRVVSWVLSC
jgi:hypothetical protein